MGQLADKLYEKSKDRRAVKTIKGAEIRAAIIELERNALAAAMKIAMFAKTVYDPDPWKNREARQAYLDCLLILQKCGIIDDFSIIKGTATSRNVDHKDAPTRETGNRAATRKRAPQLR